MGGWGWGGGDPDLGVIVICPYKLKGGGGLGGCAFFRSVLCYLVRSTDV